ncbi:hypothetical protein E2C01_041206 [Portunus trituberculatus]|uniref:Uncharacterized protein n=1 Tax=Portunus trituberculatus TaxID=210409 RepID=A0A5B7FQB3_PORTR|nr:hypothetical protein [Portunus trituberculatus]
MDDIMTLTSSKEENNCRDRVFLTENAPAAQTTRSFTSVLDDYRYPSMHFPPVFHGRHIDRYVKHRNVRWTELRGDHQPLSASWMDGRRQAAEIINIGYRCAVTKILRQEMHEARFQAGSVKSRPKPLDVMKDRQPQRAAKTGLEGRQVVSERC